MDEYAEAIAAIRAQGGTDADVAAYLRSVGATEVAPARKPLSPRMQAVGARIREDVNRREAGQRTAGEEMANAFVSALDAGTFGLAGLATDALLPGSFRENRDFRAAEMARMPARDRLLSSVAGGIANPVSRVLPVSAATPAGTGLLRVVGRGMAEGAAQGALTGLGENIGTSDGAVDDMLGGAAVGGLFGGAVAPVAQRVATSGRFAADPITQWMPGRVGANATARLGEERAAIDAARRAAASTEADVRLAPRPAATPANPPMALDVAGPATMAQARGAARSIEGREAFRGPFEARERAVTAAIADDIPDAARLERELVEARRAQADADYASAIEQTKGQPIETPSLNQLLETPTGRAAWRKVQEDRPDLVLAENDPARALPQVPVAPARPLLAGLETFEAPTPPAMRTVPDAEAIHLMTRYLRRWASGEPGQVFPEGVSAESAGNAMKLLERAKDELPEPFRLANERYAEASRMIDAVRLGRTPWKANPKPGRRAMPLAEVRERLAAMTPDERALAQEGKMFDLATRVREGTLTPQKAVERMRRPQSSLAQEIGLAGGTMGRRLAEAEGVLSRQRDVMGSGEPTATRSGLLQDAARDIAPSPWWTAIKTIRNSLSDAAMRRAGTNDAAFARLLTADPTTWDEVIANLAKRDKKAARATRIAAGMVGRSTGGLLSQPPEGQQGRAVVP